MIDYPDRQIDFFLCPDSICWSTVDAWIPFDKSISHRMILFSALAGHSVTLQGLNRGKAVTLLLDAVEQLGVQVLTSEDGSVRIDGALQPDKEERVVCLGPSSAAARLLIGALAGLGIGCVVDGDETLRSRPFDWIVEPLNQLGANLEYLGSSGNLPIRVRPATFRGGDAAIRIGSAQAVSAILYAAVAARQPVSISYPVASRDHTQLILGSFGDDVQERENQVFYRPERLLVPDKIWVPRDPSAIAYPAALFLLCNRQRPDQSLVFGDVCLNPKRLGFFSWLKLCGFSVEIDPTDVRHGEPVGSVILTGGGRLRGHDLDDKELFHAMIDEVPLALAIACLLPGEVAFKDLFELTFKESDRIQATRSTLNALALDYRVEGYEVHVQGGQVPRLLQPVPTHGDHRLSMTAHVLMLAHGLQGTIIEGNCYKTSFPEFADCLDALIGRTSDDQ